MSGRVQVLEGFGPEPTPQPLPAGFWSKAWSRLQRNRLALVSLIVLAAMCGIAVLAPWLAPYDPAAQDLTTGQQYASPSWSHLMGTDGLGRDWFSRLVFGARVSLAVGIIAQLIVLAVGLPLGLVAGNRGGLVDSAVMRFTDLAYAFPALLLVILLRGVIGGNLFLLILIIGLVTWMDVARLVRGQVLSLREREFVAASRLAGAGDLHVILRHLLPNLMGPLVVLVALGVPRAIFVEATLSFIGYGVATGTPSWGSMVQEGYSALTLSVPHLMLFPAGAIAMLMLAFTFLGDGIRDALDPTSDASAGSSRGSVI